MKKVLCKIKRKFIKFIAWICTLPVFFNDRYKKHVRNFIEHFNIVDIFLFMKFKNKPVRKNTILLLETNSCHGEVMAGYVTYFQNMGFDIDIIMQRQTLQEKPFDRLNMKNVRVLGVSGACFYFVLKEKFLNRYKNIVLMSSVYYALGSVFEWFPELSKHKSLYVVVHDTKEISKISNIIPKSHLITLGHFKNTTFVCPLYFGDVKLAPKNDITTFITVGAIYSERKNHRSLITAIEQLLDMGLKFQVVVVGDGKLKHLPQKVKSNIRITGRLNFPDMFDELEKADFFLPLLDANNPDHERYITTGVTGSAQLIYAFAKVPVLHSKFAPFYKFNNDNSVVSDDLTLGMKTAILMSGSDYVTKQLALIDLSQQLQKESAINLKQIINKKA